MAEPLASTERRKIMRALYNQGVNIPEIAQRFDVTKQRVSQILNHKPAERVPDPARRPWPSKSRAFTDEEVREIVAQCRTVPVAILAKKFNVARVTIYRILSGSTYSDVTGIAYQPHWAYDERIRAQIARLGEEENV